MSERITDYVVEEVFKRSGSVSRLANPHIYISINLFGNGLPLFTPDCDDHR
ncbi:Uncharacterised protein [Leclercia adecarboxylata]|uniref:Uncharacterized protein n=1 Tax=Leclercia adecarboxylata TaxID=83655 RepID=A0A4U9HF04_9ENTR|nr:Uncharacterised protein [Leclercia adecarboxylata]